MSDTGRFVDEPEQNDYARGLREEPPATVEEELEREREGSFARGQEVLPEDTVEKDRVDSFARGQEVLPEDTVEKVREGSFAEGQETVPHEPERVEPAAAGDAAGTPPGDVAEPFEAVVPPVEDIAAVEPGPGAPGNVTARDDEGRAPT